LPFRRWRQKEGGRSFILGFFPDDIARGGVTPSAAAGNFLLPAAMFEMSFVHDLVIRCLVVSIDKVRK
jgi:hypothetical protein